MIGNVTKVGRAALVGLAVLLVSAGIAQATAATTIGTNILTTGTLGVIGVSTFGATASTTIDGAGNVVMPGTLSVTGLATFLGGATTTSITLQNGNTITNASPNAVTISGTVTTGAGLVAGTTFSAGGASTLQTTTAASTTVTQLKVGQTGGRVTRVVAGYCVATITFAAVNVASSTPTVANCAPQSYNSGDTITITSADHVFVQATSSLPSYVVIQSASSTSGVAGDLQVQLTNFSTTTAPTTGVYAFNFWAFQ